MNSGRTIFFQIMDRGYLDYARLYKLHQSAAYFVTRAKNNARYHRGVIIRRSTKRGTSDWS